MNQNNNEKLVYSVKDVQSILGVGRNLAYDLVNSGYFPVRRIGKRILVGKAAFEKWVNSDSNSLN